MSSTMGRPSRTTQRGARSLLGDSLNKAAGTHPFLADLKLPDCAHAAVVRSPHPHARVNAVDKAALLKRPGVIVVFTPEDVPDTRFNPATLPESEHLAACADKRLLTAHPMHIGDGVALVVAQTAEQARAAVQDAPVRWEILPAVLSPSQALSEGRVLVNVTMGDEDVERVLGRAHLLIDRELVIDRAQHVCLEPHACAAVPTRGRGITLYANTQSPAEIRRLVCQVVGLPWSDLRVVKYGEGGGFGNKQEMYEEALVVWAAMTLGRALRLSFTRTEEFTATRARHGGVLRLRAAFDDDGQLRATHLEALLDSGAYASHTPFVLSCVGGHLPAVYPAGRHRFTGCAVRTNTVPSGAYRGYGVSQAATIAEQVIDEAARKLGQSPVLLRVRNFAGASGTRLAHCLDALPTLADRGRADREFEAETQRTGVGRDAVGNNSHGEGFAVAVKSSVTEPGHDLARAWVQIRRDGTVALGTGTCDSGTGSSSALARIVANELGLADPGAVLVVEGDTNAAPADLGSSAQRSIFVGGLAVRQAAKAVVRRLEARAGELKGMRARSLSLHWPEIVDVTGSTVCTVDDLLRAYPQRCWKWSATVAPSDAGISVCAVRVSVAVDTATGIVTVTEAAAVVDCGQVIDELGAAGQVAGGIGQGIGLTLLDRLEDSLTPSILDHGVPRAPDIPAIRTMFVRPEGARASSGVGELTIVPTPAAVCNAIADATGAPIARLPIVPEAVADALASRGGQ
jgi:putative selenate reductase molybdopterin-binding subunit